MIDGNAGYTVTAVSKHSDFINAVICKSGDLITVCWCDRTGGSCAVVDR